MAKKQWTAEERQAFADKMKTARQNKNPQNQNTTTLELAASAPVAPPEPVTSPAGGTTFSNEQFAELINILKQGQISDVTPSPALSPAGGLQTNPFGQVVGTFQKFKVDPAYYPDPTEALYDDFDSMPRTRRINLRENYFLVWEITAKPYETKDHTMIQEPTFHITLYMNQYDEDGEEIDRSVVVQTLHMNEDEALARLYAAEHGFEVTEEGLHELMNRTRYARAQEWLLNIFFPPRNFLPTNDFQEEAIGGSVVKVVTKSAVKGFGNAAPIIKEEELQ